MMMNLLQRTKDKRNTFVTTFAYIISKTNWHIKDSCQSKQSLLVLNYFLNEKVPVLTFSIKIKGDKR